MFEQIRRRRPKKLFIAADGPRPGRQDDIINCALARSIIDQIDWSCKVYTLFRDENLGCGKAISQAATWFFEHVEEGIILEDDCLSDPTFFDFCTTMLDRYRNDPQVMMISGTSYLFNKVASKESYFFSRYYPVWGWATWRRAWQQYDFELTDWQDLKKSSWLHDFFGNQTIVAFWSRYFDRIAAHDIDTWDIQWTYACIKQNALCITPFNNLISNIGYSGAHASGAKSYDHDIPRKPLEQVVHPARVTMQPRLDRKIYTNIHVLQPVTLRGMVKRVVRGVMGCLGK